MAGANAMINLALASLSKSPKFLIPSTSTSTSTSVRSSPFPLSKRSTTEQESKSYSYSHRVCRKRGGAGIVCALPLPLPVVDPWAPTIDSQSIASQLFAFSLFPYIAFLYFITKSKTAPSLTLFGFYFLLAFVGATIPAGIYAKVHYGTSLSNVDWLHGGAESFLTLTNLFIVLGLREGLRKAGKSKSEQNASDSDSGLKEEKDSRMEV